MHHLISGQSVGMTPQAETIIFLTNSPVILLMTHFGWPLVLIYMTVSAVIIVKVI